MATDTNAKNADPLGGVRDICMGCECPKKHRGLPFYRRLRTTNNCYCVFRRKPKRKGGRAVTRIVPCATRTNRTGRCANCTCDEKPLEGLEGVTFKGYVNLKNRCVCVYRTKDGKRIQTNCVPPEGEEAPADRQGQQPCPDCECPERYRGLPFLRTIKGTDNCYCVYRRKPTNPRGKPVDVTVPCATKERLGRCKNCECDETPLEGIDAEFKGYVTVGKRCQCVYYGPEGRRITTRCVPKEEEPPTPLMECPDRPPDPQREERWVGAPLSWALGPTKSMTHINSLREANVGRWQYWNKNCAQKWGDLHSVVVAVSPDAQPWVPDGPLGLRPFSCLCNAEALTSPCEIKRSAKCPDIGNSRCTALVQEVETVLKRLLNAAVEAGIVSRNECADWTGCRPEWVTGPRVDPRWSPPGWGEQSGDQAQQGGGGEAGGGTEGGGGAGAATGPEGGGGAEGGAAGGGGGFEGGFEGGGGGEPAGAGTGTGSEAGGGIGNTPPAF